MSPRDRLALVTWSAIAEPGDAEAALAVEQLGPAQAERWAYGESLAPGAGAKPSPRDFAVELRSARFDKARQRWVRRSAARDPHQHVRRARAIGARAVVRGDAEWPRQFDILGPAAPYCIWVRGHGNARELWSQSVAMVGSRACTQYGTSVVADIARGMADADWTVISGGAFGIDAAAHRAAREVGGASVAVMAGGVDRFYPRAHQDMLHDMCESGVVLSEVPPGYAPHRNRFLVRNRLIATAHATIVVEAAYRSGALSTARHAAERGRPVGAVPGPVTSPASAGCHRLLRDGLASVVCDVRDAIELAGPLTPARDARDAPEGDSRLSFRSERDRRAYDALARRGSGVEAIAREAGLTQEEARAALGILELDGHVAHLHGVWKKK